MRTLAALALVACGCAGMRPLQPGGFPVYQDTAAPQEDWRAPLAAGGEAREVRGEACLRGFVIPTPSMQAKLLWGEAGWAEAVAKAREQAGGGPLSDVRADVHVLNILIWREECLVVTAAAGPLATP